MVRRTKTDWVGVESVLIDYHTFAISIISSPVFR